MIWYLINNILKIEIITEKCFILSFRNHSYYILGTTIEVTESHHHEFKTGGGNYPISILPEVKRVLLISLILTTCVLLLVFFACYGSILPIVQLSIFLCFICIEILPVIMIH